MVSCVIFLIILVIQASCEQKASLTFLIDSTRSMHTELSQVKETAKSIVDIVKNERSCQIEDIVLVTFNDPKVEFRKRTQNAIELKKSLDDIVVHGGGSCPEPSLAGIKLALEESQAGSYLYVFTDASAKDYGMHEEIISMCQEKKSQIVFIITGLCGHEDDPAYRVYHEIAVACNGQVFRITKGQVREVLNYVKETIKGDLTVVTSQLVDSHLSWNYVGFNIDDETKYAMVSAAGKQVFVIVLDRFQRQIAGYERITWIDNVKVLKLNHLPPGSYFAKVRGSTEVNVKVIGRTDFTFDYGFSDNTTNSMKFTEPQPFRGASTHLIISVNDEENSVAVQTAEILDMEERVIKTLPLTDMGGAVYATEEFTPPNRMFKVAVMAKRHRTGNPLRRIAKTPVAPIRPVPVAPKISDSEKYLSAVEGSTLGIHCRITKGKPKPQMTWLFKPQGSRTFTLLHNRTDVVLRMTNVLLKHAGVYKCVAENAVGRAEHDVQLGVEAFLPATKIPFITVNQGQNLLIECMVIKGHPPPMITWQFRQANTETIQNLNTTAKVLRIENVQPRDSGFYKCHATNDLGVAQQFVQLIVQAVPEIERFPSKIVTANESTTVRINCKVTNGMPPPIITWLFRAPNAERYRLLSSNVTTLELTNIQILSNSGYYMCVAQNVAGRATQEVQLVIEALPTIKKSSPIVTAKENENVVIECKITKGTPPPTITWQYKNSKSDSFRNMNNTGEILRITNLQLNDSGFYKCRALNYVGTDEQTVQIIVTVIPQIENFPSRVIKANQGSAVQIDCNVTKGNPSPNIKWLFKPPDAERYRIIQAGVTILELRDIVLSYSGHYMCVAENSAGRATQDVELVVEDMPAIETNSPIVTEKEGNNVDIQCRITKGTPPPTITWQYKSSEFDHFRDIDNTGEILNITNLQLENSGFYKCRASNNAGFAQLTVQVIILVIPQIERFPTEIIKAKQSSTVRIDCKVTKGTPSPNITWLFKAPDAEKYQFLKAGVTKLELSDVKVGSNSGHYMCVAENSAGRATQEVELVVEDEPVIEINSPIVTEKEGKNVVIQCRITKGTPPPTISWQYKNLESDSFRDIFNTGEILNITNLQLGNSGFYKCRASNNAGFAQQNVQVIVLVAPQIESFPTEIIKAKQSSTVRIDCNVTKGSPSPNITWLFKTPNADKYQFLRADVTTLELSDVKAGSNSGHYMCVAENPAGKSTQEVELVVEDMPTIETTSPIFTEKEGNNIVIQCRIIKGTPAPTVTWQYKNSESDSFRDIDNTGEVLRITNLHLNSSGFYKCRASNNAGFAQQTIQIIVLVIPQIERFPTEIIKAKQSSTVRIDCNVTKGSPSPNITWLFKTPNTEKYQFLRAGVTTLELSDVKVGSSSGHYMCVAENLAGRATQEVELVVEAVPEIQMIPKNIRAKENASIRIDCIVTKGFPTPNITWLFKTSKAITYDVLKYASTPLELVNVQVGHSGHYKCVAVNSAGMAEQDVELVVEAPPEFEKESATITTNENLPVSIECKLRKGNPPPNITWYWQTDNPATHGSVTLDAEELTLPAVQVKQAGQYRCVAENSAGSAVMTTQLEVLAAPEIETKPIVNVKENTTIILECRIVKGVPSPSVSWMYNDLNSTAYVVISENPSLQLVNVQPSKAGHYKCVAENILGSMEQITELVVDVPPRIVFSPPNSPKYRGVEGDVVMRLSCIAEGHPKPIISWTIDNSSIGTDKSKQSYVENGSLYVKNPTSANSDSTHVCIATNEFGDDNQIYEVLVSEFEDYDHPEKKYGEVGKPYQINCSLPFTDPESVRWFYNSVYLNVTGPFIRWENASQVNDGNYTCRVSDLSGAASVTVDLTFGFPPSPSASDTEWEVEWDDKLHIACAAILIPSGKYEWYFNGEKIKDADEKELSVYKIGWGNYICRASNPWGSLDITYYIHTQDCIIDKSLSKTKNMPVILDNTLEWPTFSENQKFIVVPNSEKLTLICQDEPPRSKSSQSRAHRNRFTKFLNVRSTVATCDHEEMFLVDGISYKISELDCNYPVKPSAVPTRQQCLGENTQIIDVGFYINDFIKVYSSCVDTNRNLVLYTTVIMKGLDELWKVEEPERICKQVGDCCYETVELVNAENVGFGAVEGTTMNAQLNSVLYCRPGDDYESTDSFPSWQHLIEIPTSTPKSRREPVDTLPRPSVNITETPSYQQSTTERPNRTPMTSWHDIEKQVRKGPQMIVWSGAGNYTKVDNLIVPQYLWKVVKDLFNDKTVAIVHSNAHAPIPKLCDTECDSSSVLPLFEPHGARTYCCSLNEFKTAFNLPLEF